MKVVVTGAGGFIGSVVAKHLAESGFDVTAIHRQDVDLRLPETLLSSFDVLIHCAAETPGRCKEPDKLYSNNMDVSRSVFDQALASGAETVVFLSSISAYGGIFVPVLPEDLTPSNPNAYGLAKLDAESFLQSRGFTSALAIRLPGVVGKGSKDNYLSVAFERLMSGETVIGRNPEALFNNLVYVMDLASFVGEWIAEPRAGYNMVNLASKDPITVREMLSLMFRLSGREERLTFEPGGRRPFLISLDRAVYFGYRPATVRDSIASFVHSSI